jgi:hypothetical protein
MQQEKIVKKWGKSNIFFPMKKTHEKTAGHD